MISTFESLINSLWNPELEPIPFRNFICLESCPVWLAGRPFLSGNSCTWNYSSDNRFRYDGLYLYERFHITSSKNSIEIHSMLKIANTYHHEGLNLDELFPVNPRKNNDEIHFCRSFYEYNNHVSNVRRNTLTWRDPRP